MKKKNMYRTLQSYIYGYNGVLKGLFFIQIKKNWHYLYPPCTAPKMLNTKTSFYYQEAIPCEVINILMHTFFCNSPGPEDIE